MSIATATTDIKNLTMEHKVDAIFKFLFGGKSALAEEKFWNSLQKGEIDELTAIRKERKHDFSMLKKKHAGKK